MKKNYPIMPGLILAVIMPSFGALAEVRPQLIPGITAPVKEARLSSVVPGTIFKIHVEEGSRVSAGDLLMELDKRFELLEVDRRKIISESKAEYEAAEKRMDLLKNEWETTRQLFESTKSISQEDMDRKELEYKLAAAEFERIKSVELQEEVEHRMAMEQLNRREIRSPLNGVVTSIFLHEGESCDPRQPLLNLVDDSQCEFICNIQVEQAARLSEGLAVKILAENGVNQVERAGKVFFISPVVDSASGLQEVQVRFDNHDGKISPGVTAVLVLGERSGE